MGARAHAICPFIYSHPPVFFVDAVLPLLHTQPSSRDAPTTHFLSPLGSQDIFNESLFFVDSNFFSTLSRPSFQSPLHIFTPPYFFNKSFYIDEVLLIHPFASRFLLYLLSSSPLLHLHLAFCAFFLCLLVSCPCHAGGWTRRSPSSH